MSDDHLALLKEVDASLKSMLDYFSDLMRHAYVAVDEAGLPPEIRSKGQQKSAQIAVIGEVSLEKLVQSAVKCVATLSKLKVVYNTLDFTASYPSVRDGIRDGLKDSSSQAQEQIRNVIQSLDALSSQELREQDRQQLLGPPLVGENSKEPSRHSYIRSVAAVRDLLQEAIAG